MINMLKIQLRSKQAPLLALVACLTMQIGAPQNVAAQLANNSLIPQAESNVRIERKVRGIPAELVDAGDYYFRPDGSKVKMLRKKDVFVVKADPSKRQRVMQRFKARYGDRVEEIRKHRLGGANVVRLDNRTTTKARKQQSFDIQPQMLEALDNSVSDMVPVFATEKGQGDLLLLSKITLQLNGSENIERALQTLKRKYGVELNRKLRLAGNIYSLNFTNRNLAPSSQFSVVRRIMKESFVDWAEPQFFVKPERAALPNDTLVGDQWHLANKGFRGSRCDTDCDADDAWGEGDAGDDNGINSVFGEDVVIAIIDDGVQLDHPDLMANIWVNTAENSGSASNDDDGNGYDDDINGYDFVDDTSIGNTCENGQPLHDGSPGQDSDPSPRATVECFLDGQAEPLENDNHGTAVAGIAAAVGNNSAGVAGVAYRAKILSIRAISDFDEVPLATDNESFCDTIAEAMEYAAQHADVINNSWSIPITCTALETALTRVTEGTVPVDNDPNDGDGLSLGSKRVNLGSPVIFASGNNASGWVKVTVPVSAGEHAFEWRFLRSPIPEFFEGNELDSAWLDDVVWPDGTTEGFDGAFVGANDISGFTNDCVLNRCDEGCDGEIPDCALWTENINPDFIRDADGTGSSAQIDMLNGFCAYSYLHTIRSHNQSGEISFWIWVNTNTAEDSDKFEFLVDGKEVISYGDLAAFGSIDNAVAYPARLANQAPTPILGVIAVGASTSGDLSGQTTISPVSEERAPYSQYGSTLDLVAPGGGQHLGIATTDRTGSDGFNSSGAGADYSDTNYTKLFNGTSAAAPIVSGIAAALISIDETLEASEIRDILKDTADKIGFLDYDNGGVGRNDFFGDGRVNMFRAIRFAQDGSTVADPTLQSSCAADTFDLLFSNDLILPNYTPQSTQFCAAEGPVPENDDLCVPIRSVNGNIAIVCL